MRLPYRNCSKLLSEKLQRHKYRLVVGWKPSQKSFKFPRIRKVFKYRVILAKGILFTWWCFDVFGILSVLQMMKTLTRLLCMSWRFSMLNLVDTRPRCYDFNDLNDCVGVFAGWWFQSFFVLKPFYPDLWGDDPLWLERIFSNGLGKKHQIYSHNWMMKNQIYT